MHVNRFQFIRNATGLLDAIPSIDLEADSSLREYIYIWSRPSAPNVQVRLVEVPGFDNTTLEDLKIITQLVEYLARL